MTRRKRNARILIWAGFALTFLSLVGLFASLAYIATNAPQMGSDVIFYPFAIMLSAGSALLWLPIRNSLLRLIGMDRSDSDDQ
jgi:hypothetical protein